MRGSSRRTGGEEGADLNLNCSTRVFSTKTATSTCRGIRESFGRGHLHPHRSVQSRPGCGAASRDPASVVSQHLVLGGSSRSRNRHSHGLAEEDAVCLVADDSRRRRLANLPFNYRLGQRYLYGESGTTLFTDNETNTERCMASRSQTGRFRRTRFTGPS